MAVLAPMPRASVKTMTAVKPGLWRMKRKAQRRFWISKDTSGQASARVNEHVETQAWICQVNERFGVRGAPLGSSCDDLTVRGIDDCESGQANGGFRPACAWKGILRTGVGPKRRSYGEGRRVLRRGCRG